MSQRNVTFRWIPSGDSGALDTLQWMRTLVKQAQRQPLLLRTAQAILKSGPAGDAAGQALALRDWLSQHFEFVRDPSGFELLKEPLVQLQDIEKHYVSRGDCDDAAILGAALAKAMGLKARFRALAFVELNAPYTHVISDVLTPHGWLDLDVTKSAQFIPPNTSRSVTTMEL